MKGLETLAGRLAEVDRRIDNMTFLMRFQVEKRERILTSMREAIGRSHVGTTPIPSGKWRPVEIGVCAACGNAGPTQAVRALEDDHGSAHVARAEDVAMLGMGVLILLEGWSDLGEKDVHPGCARDA